MPLRHPAPIQQKRCPPRLVPLVLRATSQAPRAARRAAQPAVAAPAGAGGVRGLWAGDTHTGSRLNCMQVMYVWSTGRPWLVQGPHARRATANEGSHGTEGSNIIGIIRQTHPSLHIHLPHTRPSSSSASRAALSSGLCMPRTKSDHHRLNTHSYLPPRPPSTPGACMLRAHRPPLPSSS
jgi:hypothetical protein